LTGWREIKLGELVDSGFAETRTGPFGTQLRASDYTRHGVPVINVRNLGYGTIRPAELERVGLDVQQRLSAHLLIEGDIVFGRKGAVDRHVLITSRQEGWMQGSDCIRFRLLPGSPVSSLFLSKALLAPSHKAWMEAQCSHGSTMASLNQEIVSRIPIRVPGASFQRRIAAVLSAFDELIEINERRIELLEGLARSLYREWFVHFRFPRHEDVEFVGSELGRIPQGWEVRQLADVLSLDKGLSYKGAYLTGSGQPMANLKCFAPRGGFRRLGSKPYSGSYGERHSVVSGDLIVANTDLTQAGHVIGSPAIVPRRDFSDGGLISHHLFAVRPLRGREDVPFLFQLMLDGRFRDFARARASGTTVLGLRAYDLIKYPFVAPPASIQARFSEVTRLAMEEADALVDQSETLAATRDLLLPSLVTGRLDISDVDLGDLLPDESE
jgi:type I restriction enzyme S subunit